jgi:hypothetical protein
MICAVGLRVGALGLAWISTEQNLTDPEFLSVG